MIAGDLAPPYPVTRGFAYYAGLVHEVATFSPDDAEVTCCRQQFGAGVLIQRSGVSALVQRNYTAPTCIACVLCTGCPACVDGYIREETMCLGKWETKDGRRLYPFEMDSIHLMNALAKILRDQENFKKNWQEWVKVLAAEAKLRRLA